MRANLGGGDENGDIRRNMGRQGELGANLADGIANVNMSRNMGQPINDIGAGIGAHDVFGNIGENIGAGNEIVANLVRADLLAGNEHGNNAGIMARANLGGANLAFGNEIGNVAINMGLHSNIVSNLGGGDFRHCPGIVNGIHSSQTQNSALNNAMAARNATTAMSRENMLEGFGQRVIPPADQSITHRYGASGSESSEHDSFAGNEAR